LNRTPQAIAADYAKNKALVFEGIDFLGVYLLLIRKRYDVLAEHLVNINDTFASEEEAIKLMKQRTAFIPVPVLVGA
jgi:hypothetical protein